MEIGRTIIVNEEDEEIGYKLRDDVTPEDIYRATGLWIENSKGEVLMAQRSFKKKNSPGLWGPAVSGTVEEGETYDSNIYKEAREEIGLEGIQFQKKDKLRVHGRYNYFAQWYWALVDKEIEDFVIKEDEVEGLKWFGKKELADVLGNNPEIFVTGLKQNSKLINNLQNT